MSTSTHRRSVAGAWHLSIDHRVSCLMPVIHMALLSPHVDAFLSRPNPLSQDQNITTPPHG
jgi:hypothetical protein